jgi:hypothetical protein
LSEDVGLDVAVVVFGGPDETAGGFQGLGDHVVDEAVLVFDSAGFELGGVVSITEKRKEKKKKKGRGALCWRLTLHMFFKVQCRKTHFW